MKKLCVLLAVLAIGVGIYAAAPANNNDLEFLAKSMLSEKKMMEVMEGQVKRLPPEIAAQLRPGFQEDFMKAMRPKYPDMVKALSAVIQELYTPEQIAILVEFHKKNPWVGDKNYDLMDKSSQAFSKLGTEAGEQMMNEMKKPAEKK
jgi:hypothetical protein